MSASPGKAPPMKGLPLAGKKSPLPVKGPPGAKSLPLGEKRVPMPGGGQVRAATPGKLPAPGGKQLPMAASSGGPKKAPPSVASKVLPPGAKSPAAPALKGPPGKVPSGSAGAKVPLKAPHSSTKSAAAAPIKAPPGAKLALGKSPAAPALKAPPGKLPLKLPAAPGAPAPPKLAKLALAKAAATPPADSLAASRTPSEAGEPVPPPPDTARTDATFVQGDREDPGSPMETPRDMPGGGEDSMPVDTPMASPRTELSPPPPPPPPPLEDHRGNGLGRLSPTPQSAAQGHSEKSDTATSSIPRRDGGAGDATTTPSADTAAWAVHSLSLASPHRRDDGGSVAAGTFANAEQIRDYERKISDLERRVVETESRFTAVSAECSRLRETLYDREGYKVVQHIESLERDNRVLRQALQREKDSVMYHQNAHMQCLDELVALRHSVNNVGDYNKLKSECEKAQQQVSQLVRANTELSLRLSDMNEVQAMGNCALDPLDTPIRDQGLPPYVRVRRAALCVHCKDMVDRWEALLIRRTSQNLLPQASSPVQGGSALYFDPRGAHGSIESLSGINSSSGVDHTGARGWRPLRLPNGNIVYHNIITNKSQWERPV